MSTATTAPHTAYLRRNVAEGEAQARCSCGFRGPQRSITGPGAVADEYTAALADLTAHTAR